jgi:hypothetical protein
MLGKNSIRSRTLCWIWLHPPPPPPHHAARIGKWLFAYKERIRNRKYRFSCYFYMMAVGGGGGEEGPNSNEGNTEEGLAVTSSLNESTDQLEK